MKKLFIAAKICAVFFLAGCVSVKDDYYALQSALIPVSQEWKSRIENNEAFIPLIGNIPLWENNRSDSMLTNSKKPNELESLALEAYLQARVSKDKAQSTAIEKFLTKKQKNADRAYTLQEWALISDLKNGLLTWGDYNRREYALREEAQQVWFSLWAERVSDEREMNARMAAFGQALAQGAQQYGNSLSRAYAPQQQYGSTYNQPPSYEPSVTWTSRGNIMQGSNGVTVQSFGNRDVITYPNGQTRNCSTFGNITTCSPPSGF